ncbi:hypothetical protein [Sorangium sp. So ce1151]|uniref:hypothetical protein n=1 Tax=Sorangium sp. So ce1151 TaxID=3133332 RepID=UPI003F62EC45
MVMLEAVVLRSLPPETAPSATACTFPAEGISISFLVIAIAVLTMLASSASRRAGAKASAGMTHRLTCLRRAERRP